MALWGNDDNVGSTGTVELNYSTGVVTGTGTSFGIAGGCAEGDVIRFGIRGGVYFGDAVIASIANSESLTIAATDFTVSQLPKSSVFDSKYSEASYGTEDSLVYGISEGRTAAYGSTTSSYRLDGEGWVGVTTYVDTHGNLRVKKEILVAMSGISTGDGSINYPTDV